MKSHHIILVLLASLNACKHDGNRNGLLGTEGNGYLSKDEVVQEFVKLGQAYSGASLIEEEFTPINRETGEPYQLLPAGTFQREGGGSTAPAYALESTFDSSQDSDLRAWATPVQNQGNELTCTAFSTIGAMELAAKVKTGKEFNLSERHLWNLYRQGAVESAVNAGSKRAIVGEDIWPYSSQSKPSSASLDKGVVKIKKYSSSVLGVDGILQALKNRQPVVFGGTMPAYNKKGVMYGLNRAGDHAMAIFGAQVDSRVKGGGYFIVKNSYGINDGDKGYIYVPFSYCAQTCWARAVEEVEVVGDSGNSSGGKNEQIMAMIGSGSGDSYTMWMSAPSEATRLVFCAEAQASACQAGAKGFTETTLQQTRGSAAVFKANSSLSLSQNLQIAVAAFDSSGRMVASRNLKFEQK